MLLLSVACAPLTSQLGPEPWVVEVHDPQPPPPGAVTVAADPVVPGVSSDVRASGLGVGDVAHFFASAAGPGAGPCPGALGGACLGVLPKVVRLGNGVADAAGVATVTVPWPPTLVPSTSLWLQAAVPVPPGPAVLSQVVEVVISDGCENLEAWDLHATWARSEVASRVVAAAVGVCIPAAIGLPVTAPTVWDDGDDTPPGWFEDGLAAGRSWASWDQVGVDCHHFQLVIDVPACPYDEIVVDSPWFEGVPINDNLYVMVDGVERYRAGTSYAFGYGGPMEVDTYLTEPIRLRPDWLTPGVNTIDIVVEEYAAWGGLGFLEAVLIP